jgi:uncharacterized protein YcbK (DUF882 family)
VTGYKLPALHGRPDSRQVPARGFPLRQVMLQVLCWLMLMFAAAPVFLASANSAAAETRSLKIYFIHTGEKANIVYKRNGRYDPKGLKQLNHILRDWRRNESTNMNPRLFDVLWQVYRQSGSNGYINVVSGYRSPATNAMLRSRSSGVAKKSQHMLGTAVDFFIPGVQLAKIREIGMKLQAGGVGYYPRSGSPFVHMDVGSVRAWPRMTRQELVKLFPNGRTLHIPADGKPLPGYELAMADYKKRLSSNTVLVADKGGGKSRGKTLFAALFGGGDEDEGEDVGDAPATVSAPAPAPQVVEQAPVQVASVELPGVDSIEPPVPLLRPSLKDAPANIAVAAALLPPAHNEAEDALAAAMPENPTDAGEEYADLADYDDIPVPTLLAARGVPGDADQGNMTASADDGQWSRFGDAPAPQERPAYQVASLTPAELRSAGLSADEVVSWGKKQQEAGHVQHADQILTAAVLKSGFEQKPIMTAYAAPDPVKQVIKQNSGLGDAFDVPEAADNSLAKGLPVKGSRPDTAEAIVARVGDDKVRVELTRKMLSDWAVANAVAPDGAGVIKAPRFAGDAIRRSPAIARGTGFSTQTQPIDAGRFSGSADELL